MAVDGIRTYKSNELPVHPAIMNAEQLKYSIDEVKKILVSETDSKKRTSLIMFGNRCLVHLTKRTGDPYYLSLRF